MPPPGPPLARGWRGRSGLGEAFPRQGGAGVYARKAIITSARERGGLRGGAATAAARGRYAARGPERPAQAIDHSTQVQLY